MASPSAPAILAELHSALLRQLCDVADRPFTGLATAGRWLRRPRPPVKRLMRLGMAVAFNRHARHPMAEAFLGDVAQVLFRQGCGVRHMQKGNTNGLEEQLEGVQQFFIGDAEDSTPQVSNGYDDRYGEIDVMDLDSEVGYPFTTEGVEVQRGDGFEEQGCDNFGEPVCNGFDEQRVELQMCDGLGLRVCDGLVEIGIEVRARDGFDVQVCDGFEGQVRGGVLKQGVYVHECDGFAGQGCDGFAEQGDESQVCDGCAEQGVKFQLCDGLGAQGVEVQGCDGCELQMDVRQVVMKACLCVRIRFYDVRAACACYLYDASCDEG